MFFADVVEQHPDVDENVSILRNKLINGKDRYIDDLLLTELYTCMIADTI